MSIFWIGGPEGVIVPPEEINFSNEDRYFMPGIIHGSEDYIIQAYYWSTEEGPAGDRIGIKYLFAESLLEWAEEATGENGVLNEALFSDLVNENAEEFIVENDGTGDFVLLRDVWSESVALDHVQIIAWARSHLAKKPCTS